jgi:hypothetical protein
MKLTTHAGAAIGAAVIVIATAGVATAASRPAAAGRVARAAANGPAAVRHRLISAEDRAKLRAQGHVEVVKHTRRRGDVTIELQRGEITAVTATSITLRSKDGYSHTYTVTSATKVRERRSQIAIGDLSVGERAMVVAVRTNGGDIARRIACVNVSSAQTKKAQEPTPQSSVA